MDDLEALLEGDPRVERAVRAEIDRHRLCDSCLGRQLGKVDRGTNAQRGEVMRRVVSPEAGPVPPEDCELCEGLVEEYDDLAAEVLRVLGDYEWSTFLVGTKVPARVLRLEAELSKGLGTPWAEPLKMEVNREVGKRVEAATDGEVDLQSPDVTVLVDPEFNTAEAQVRSVYVYGRYTKLERGIPQTRWPCRSCRGRGCASCGGTGKQYPTSVEELVAAPFMVVLEGQEHALHGAGREDVDARMLGNGRPFILEIRGPRRRSWDPVEMERRVNGSAAGRVNVTGLRPSEKREVVSLKGSNFEKTYRIALSVEGGVERGALEEAASALDGAEVVQRTPERVSHRRADKERHRMVRRFALLEAAGDTAVVEVQGESGIYVKELIHGDRGRTRPSLSALLGRPCEVVELDVLQVHDGG